MKRCMAQTKDSGGQLVIRAYCSRCGGLCMESYRLTKKKLHEVWDRSVLQATQIKCEKCGTKFPNFEIDLRIANVKIGREYLPTEYITAKHKEDPLKLFKSISEEWIKEHPDVTPPTEEEIKEAIKRARDGKKSADGESNS